VIAAWSDERRLARPHTHKFQFSLQALLLAVLGLGGYVSGLVLMFGD